MGPTATPVLQSSRTGTAGAAAAVPAVSVLMAVRNGERFIDEAIASVLGQTLADLFPAQAARFLTSFRPIFFGLVLMIFLIFEPRGLAYRWQIIKASWRLRPFSR